MPAGWPTVRIARDPAIAPLFIARLVSSAGVGFGQLALVWGVKGLGYGPGALSLVLACKAAPMLLILVGGVVGDRFKRHQVLAGAEALASITWLALGVCFMAGNVPLVLLCALAALSGTATAMFLPTIRGVIADLLVPENRQAGNALISQTDSAGLLVGLAASGMVVTFAGAGWAAGAKGALCAISALLLTRLKTTSPNQAHARPLTDLWTGWRRFSGCRWVWVMTLQFTAVIVAVASFTEIIGPLHLSQHDGGARAWGIIAACEALGALLGGFASARWRPRHPVLAAALLPASAAAPIVLLASGSSWEVVAVSMLLPGVCQATYYVLWTTELQKTFPSTVLARVNSWGIVGSFSLTPVALLLAGPAVEAVGTRPAAFGAAALILTATAAALLALIPTRRTPSGDADAPAGLVASS